MTPAHHASKHKSVVGNPTLADIGAGLIYDTAPTPKMAYSANKSAPSRNARLLPSYSYSKGTSRTNVGMRKRKSQVGFNQKASARRSSTKNSMSNILAHQKFI